MHETFLFELMRVYRFLAEAFLFRAFGLAARLTRSGRRFPPVSRFHSSYVAGEIFPSTSNSANFRRCARDLNGIL